MTCLTFARSSMTFAPFTKIPLEDNPPIPAKNDRGIEITRAHGQEITKNVQALRIPSLKSPNAIPTIRATAIAKNTTIGV